MVSQEPPLLLGPLSCSTPSPRLDTLHTLRKGRGGLVTSQGEAGRQHPGGGDPDSQGGEAGWDSHQGLSLAVKPRAQGARKWPLRG